MTENFCPGREETVHLFLDGELNPTERAIFVTHLQTCPNCQALLTKLEMLFSQLTSLEEVTAPPELVNQVMAHLPAPQPSTRRVTLGQLALVGQVAVGLALLLIFAPAMTTVLASPLVWQLWFWLYEFITSLAFWLKETLAGLVSLAQTQWPPALPWPVIELSPLWIGVIVAGLSLAWLIGNGLLLRRYPTSFKNGGVS